MVTPEERPKRAGIGMYVLGAVCLAIAAFGAYALLWAALIVFFDSGKPPD